MRTYSYRIDVLRNGAKFGELKAIEPPEVNFSSSAEIKSGISGLFKYDPLFDFLSDEIKPWQVIDGVEKPIGVFSVGTYEDEITDTEHNVKIEAYDRCYRLFETKTETILHLSSGTNYIDAIKGLLATAGIVLYIATPTSSVLSTDREDWDIGTDYLTIINALLAEINYHDIWFDENGYAILQPIQKIDSSRIKHYYDANSNISILEPNCSVTTDIFSKPNVFIVVCNNPDFSEPLVSTIENNNPLSSLSIFKRKRRIAQVYRVDNIADKEALDAYASDLCSKSMLSLETATIMTANESGHGIDDIIAINHPKLQGLYQEKSWNLTLGAGNSMIHVLERSVLI